MLLKQLLDKLQNRSIDIARYPCYCDSMIQSFKDEGTQDIFNGRATKKARKRCSAQLWRIAARKLDQLDSAEQLEDLKVPPGNRLELLSGNRKGQHSIRVNEQYRICFVWQSQGPCEVEIVDYHR